MTPATALAVCGIWLGVGFAGYFTDNQWLIAYLGALAMYSTAKIAERDV